MEYDPEHSPIIHRWQRLEPSPYGAPCLFGGPQHFLAVISRLYQNSLYPIHTDCVHTHVGTHTYIQYTHIHIHGWLRSQHAAVAWGWVVGHGIFQNNQWKIRWQGEQQCYVTVTIIAITFTLDPGQMNPLSVSVLSLPSDSSCSSSGPFIQPNKLRIQ